MKKLSSLFFFCLAFCAFTILPIQSYAQFNTSAKNAYLIDFETEIPLFSKNADVKMPPSSMAKLMTIYILFDALKQGKVNLDDKFKISKKAWKKGGSKMFVLVGDEVSVKDLIRGVIVQSGNDACITIAENLAGTEEAFAKEMNAYAEKLGLTDSNFTNATGWPDKELYVTAQDLAKLAIATIRDFPEYYSYYSEIEFTYANIRQFNRNTLLGRGIGADGLKTGYTKTAGYGLVSSAKDELGRRLVAVVNGAETERVRIDQSEKLLRYGFREFSNELLYKAGDIVGEIPLWLAANPTVQLITLEDVKHPIPTRFSVKKDYKFSIIYNSPVKAPIKKDEELAKFVITNDGEILKEVPIFARNDVAQTNIFKRFFEKLKASLKN